MSDYVTVSGLVATEPRHLVTQEGLAITSFRLASMHRRFDQARNEWRDDGTNWYSVAAFRTLAKNAASSLEKGQRVIVSGRLKIREWSTEERSGVSVDVEADAIGHDLLWGSSTFERNPRPPVDRDDEAASREATDDMAPEPTDSENTEESNDTF
jgi:single-strand DNA-binding protein